MSIENAILELAAALRQVAEANQAIAAASLKTEESYRASIGAYAAATAAGAPPVSPGSIDAELETAVTQVETDAKADQKKVMDQVAADRKPTAARAAIEDALAKLRAEKAKPVVEEDPLDAVDLDWDKDVRPVLLKTGKDALVKLMAKYEIPKGGKAPVDKWADLLVEANAIVAARG